MRRAVLVLVAALVVALVPVVAPTPATAARTDVIAVIVEGTGYGHGRGMSQWGAYGYAVDEGRTWQWILDHYYGGTTLGSVASSGRIRVRLLGADGQTTTAVTSNSGNVSGGGKSARSMYAEEISPNQFKIYGSSSMACPGGTTLSVPNGPIAQGSGATAAVRQIQTFLNAFRVAGDTYIAVDGDFGPQTATRLRDWQGDQGLPVNGVWNSDDAARARQQINGSGAGSWTPLATVNGPVVFTNANSEKSGAQAATVLGLCDGSGRITHYRGKLEVRSDGDGNHVVNDLKTEDYLRGVVSKEISASWADAGGGKGANAVRAQAVAARSYGLQQNRYGYASICDSQSCQVYGGSATRATANSGAILVEDTRTDAAIAATAGNVRKWPNGTIASTEFSASNGPRTAGGVFTPVNDTGDATAKNPNHKWTRVLDADTLAATYGLGSLTSASMIEAANATYQQFDGIWFNDVVLTGTSGSKRMNSWDFRGAYGLPSPGFTVRVVTEDTTGKSFAMIGDSVGTGIAGSATSPMRTLTDGTFSSTRFDVVTSRCTTRTSCPGSSGVEAAGQVPTGTDLVLVELGYNDNPSTFGSDIDAMMTALRARGVKRVAWVNLSTGGNGAFAQSNAALLAARGRWPNLTVLDWNTASNTSERSRWFASDGVHLSSTGNAQFSVWLRQQVLGLAPSHWLSPPKVIEIPVVGQQLAGPTGAKLSVPANAAAVALNVTAVDPIGPGFVTVWPCGVDRPVASNLNFTPNSRVANGVIAPIGTNGKVCVYSHAGTDLVVDVAGWIPGGSGDDAAFVGATPERLVDTRSGVGGRTARVTPSTPLRIPVVGTSVGLPGGGSASIPAGASAVALNVTVVDPSAQGYVTVWPCGVDRPLASNLNFLPGARLANGVVAPIGADGSVCLYSHAPTDIVVDVAGWFGSGAGAFTGATPKRVVDTRVGTGGRSGHVAPSSPLAIPVRGVGVAVDGAAVKIPADASAVALNLTIVDPIGQGYATVWPCGAPRPTASNVNFLPGRRVANGVIAPIGADGSVCVYTHANTHVVVDIAGWFAGGSSPGFVGATPKRFVDTRFAIGPAPT